MSSSLWYLCGYGNQTVVISNRDCDCVQAELAGKLSKLQKEKDFLQQTSESLLRNQDDFRTQLIAEQTKSKAKDSQITDLTEQVCNLFMSATVHVSLVKVWNKK